MRWLEDLWQHGAEAAIERTLAIAGGDTDGLHLTVDIDSLDGAFAPGTSTPTPGGLTSCALLTLVRGIAGQSLLGMDVVETAPTLESTSITAGMAVRVVMDALAAHAGADVRRSVRSAGLPARVPGLRRDGSIAAAMMQQESAAHGVSAELKYPAPPVSCDEARSLARSVFALDVKGVRALPGERDRNFCGLREAGPCPQFALRVIHPAEDPAVTAFQTLAMLHVATADPELVIPRVISPVHNYVDATTSESSSGPPLAGFAASVTCKANPGTRLRRQQPNAEASAGSKLTSTARWQASATRGRTTRSFWTSNVLTGRFIWCRRFRRMPRSVSSWISCTDSFCTERQAATTGTETPDGSQRLQSAQHLDCLC